MSLKRSGKESMIGIAYKFLKSTLFGHYYNHSAGGSDINDKKKPNL